MANPDSAVADQAAAALHQMLVGDGMAPELVEVLLVLLGYCLAAVGPLGGSPPLADAQLAALDPFQVVQQYLASQGITELGAGGCWAAVGAGHEGSGAYGQGCGLACLCSHCTTWIAGNTPNDAIHSRALH
jgi:hypothetical protein